MKSIKLFSPVVLGLDPELTSQSIFWFLHFALFFASVGKITYFWNCWIKI